MFTTHQSIQSARGSRTKLNIPREGDHVAASVCEFPHAKADAGGLRSAAFLIAHAFAHPSCSINPVIAETHVYIINFVRRNRLRDFRGVDLSRYVDAKFFRTRAHGIGTTCSRIPLDFVLPVVV